MNGNPNTFSRAVKFFKNGDVKAAETLCQTIPPQSSDYPEAIHLLGLIAFQTGKTDEALSKINQAIVLAPNNPALHNSYGSLLFRLGRFAEAEPSLRKAVDLAPELIDPIVNLGNALLSLGRPAEAEDAFRRALVLQPNLSDIHSNLGIALRDLGRLDEAAEVLRASLALNPDQMEAVYALGEVLCSLGQMAEAETAFRLVVEAVPSFIPAQTALTQTLYAQQKHEDAIEALDRVRALAPDHPLVDFATRLIYSDVIPGWHLSMINDLERNDAYRKAVERAVEPGMSVLEIGTGSALVAMFAARAGAQLVVTCEVNPLLARVAEETVTRNGFTGKICVVPKISTLLRVGVDLPEPADVFISELINIGMLAPNMLPVLRHARTHLVKPNAKIIPAAARVYGQLIQCDELARINPARQIEGFDLSAFDRFRPPGYGQIDLASDSHIMLSDPFTALDFDFRVDMPDSGRRDFCVKAAVDGLCHGIVFWFDLMLDEETTYSSASRARTNHWKQAIQFFERPLSVSVGDEIDVAATYNKTCILFIAAGT
ncbi:Predicted RNA methylase [Azospirillaceae bacterium]